ncbi:MAG: Rpn family recombination-promoting nuclease/putative transposase [Nostoc sp. ChiQUE02]|uniref:DUF4351 domain-containing protein n=1 Tax=Nostoc sp. ChiQUE02 TaxID=3075377 RepID=UPI002AD1DC74|nr:DUF4351 domain-containing protein [Nostoc sp. ChiQUE02]MDZ8234836.1 DUF4351 domain-containing protein [Nostoc sp. ChiQUE02]
MTYDNTLKYLVEQYPEDFVRYLLASEATDIQILKTELNQEPIRADSVTFLQTANQILHLEFQTLPASTPPLPLRMLDYWVRLYRQYNCDIEQIVIFLKPTTSETVFVDQFTARNTSHHYRVIQDPEPLLLSPGLLPLATLARTDSPQSLLQQVAVQVSMIEEAATKQSISVCTQLLAGLVFEPELIRQFLRIEDMRESAIYQEILQEGLQEGREQGIEQGRQSELRLVMRLLNRRLGSINSQLQSRLQELSLVQLENLGEVLLDFASEADLMNWLNRVEA